MYLNRRTVLFLSTILMTSPTIAADKTDSLSDALLQGKPNIEHRYRLASVDADGFPRQALASTLRTKLGYKTKTYKGFTAYAEVDNILAIGAENYNDTLNGKTNFPVVADPESTEFNQYYLMYQHQSGLWSKVGRQTISIDGRRFIGTAPWRQNDRTFDAAAIGFKKDKFSAAYYYIWNVNRVVSGDHPRGNYKTNTHVLQANYKHSELLNAQVTGYLIDLNTGFTDLNQNLSSQTYSAKLNGQKTFDALTLGYRIEYGTQSDYATNTQDFSADYQVYEAVAKGQNWHVILNQEVLGSENGRSLSTPFGNLHKHNGHADIFLGGTPSEGLKDTAVTTHYTLPKSTGDLAGINLSAVYHDFKSENGDISYGSEWNLILRKKLSKGLSLMVEGAFYKADQYASDTKKLWFVLTAKY